MLEGLGRRGSDRPAEPHTVREFVAVLRREQARVLRHGGQLCLVAFVAREPDMARTALDQLTRLLAVRLRGTDEIGWLDETRLGAALPGATTEGAWRVIDDIYLAFPAGLTPPACTIYTFDGSWRGEAAAGVPLPPGIEDGPGGSAPLTEARDATPDPGPPPGDGPVPSAG